MVCASFACSTLSLHFITLDTNQLRCFSSQLPCNKKSNPKVALGGNSFGLVCGYFVFLDLVASAYMPCSIRSSFVFTKVNPSYFSSSHPSTKKATRRLLYWLGWLDSNQRITRSKPVALPLGYTPILIGMSVI